MNMQYTSSTSKDNMLLMESYELVYFKESFENYTIGQLLEMSHNCSDTQYRIIEEGFGDFFRGVRNAGAGVANVAKGVGGSIQRGAQAAGNAIKNAGTTVGNAARRTVGAVKGAAQQVGSNVKNMYQTGTQDAAAQGRIQKINQHIKDLGMLLQQHLQASPNSRLANKNIMNLTLGQLSQAFDTKGRYAGQAVTAARTAGPLAGVGGAAKAGYSAAQQATPSPLPAGAPATA
jgi:hypothetical protein